jgi:hypothetical protein
MSMPPVQTRRFTRAEYDKLISQGFFDEDRIWHAPYPLAE